METGRPVGRLAMVQRTKAVAEGVEEDGLSDGLGVGKESNMTPVSGLGNWEDGGAIY